MAEQRTTQLPAEALTTGTGNVRATQVPVESLQTANNQFIRATQVPVEVLFLAPGGYVGINDAVLWKRTGTKVSIGTNVDKMTLNFYPSIGQALTGLPWPQAVAQGALDGAHIVVERAALTDWANALEAPEKDTAVPVGSTVIFSGRVSHTEPSRNEIVVEVTSDLELLNVQVPRNLYQPGCIHTLFDSGCTLSKATFSVGGTVTAGSTKSLVVASGLAQASGYFDLGTVKFTSGANSGLTRSVKTHLLSGPSLELVLPLPSLPGVGDTFTVTPGCDKKSATCTAKFANLVHFRGFPFVPVPEQAR